MNDTSYITFGLWPPEIPIEPHLDITCISNEHGFSQYYSPDIRVMAWTSSTSFTANCVLSMWKASKVNV